MVHYYVIAFLNFISIDLKVSKLFLESLVKAIC